MSTRVVVLPALNERYEMSLFAEGVVSAAQKAGLEGLLVDAVSEKMLQVASEGQMARHEIVSKWLDESVPFDAGSRDVLVLCGRETAVGVFRVLAEMPSFKPADSLSPRQQTVKTVKAVVLVGCLPAGAGKYCVCLLFWLVGWLVGFLFVLLP